MTDNGDIFRLLLIMLHIISDRSDGGSVTGTLNTMMIMALLAGSGGNNNCPNGGSSDGGGTFPDSA